MFKLIKFVGLLIFVLSVNSFAADRALLVGVDKYKNPGVPEISGCANDAEKTAEFLVSKFGFPRASIKVLRNEEATASNIQNSFRDWLINGTKSGDRVFFLYSGHGSQLPDDNGDEEDKKDETIAPYDANPLDINNSNMIRDDVFDQLIAQLSGRRAVMVFDCCHSGTISRSLPSTTRLPRGGGGRYLPSPTEFRDLVNAQGYSFSSVGNRDLIAPETFVKTAEINALTSTKTKDFNPLGENISGVVVISAAQANQVAFPLLVDGEYRGALSYTFTELQKNSSPSFRELKTNITQKIEQLQKSGELTGNQRPSFEIISTVPLDDQPLFGSEEEIPAIALTNPLSKIKINIATTENKTTYYDGENVSYKIDVSDSGYLYLIVFSTNNVATCIFPNENDKNNSVSAGRISVPKSGYTFPIQEPYGRDIVVAMLSKDKINLGDKLEYKWSEVFDIFNNKELQDAVGAAARGQGVRKKDWQASVLILESKPKK